MIVLSGALTDILPGYVITYDTLLISIFGGLINGLVISLCLAVNATTGGTDFIAIFLSDRKGIDSWNMILGLNVVILSLIHISMCDCVACCFCSISDRYVPIV